MGVVIHPPRATKTELDSKITIHAAIAAAHHTAYTDALAILAMGTKADDNPLNHDRYTLEEHGSDKHTDVTRNQFYPSFGGENGMGPMHPFRFGIHYGGYFFCRPSMENRVWSFFRIPNDLVSIIALYPVIWLKEEVCPAGGGTLVWYVKAEGASDGEVSETISNVKAKAVTTVETNKYKLLPDSKEVLVGVDKNDFMQLELFIDGTDGDSAFQEAASLGFLLEYTAEQ